MKTLVFLTFLCFVGLIALVQGEGDADLPEEKGRGYHAGLKKPQKQQKPAAADEGRSFSYSRSGSDSRESGRPSKHRPSYGGSYGNSYGGGGSWSGSDIRECKAKLGKLDAVFRKCEADGDNAARELMAVAKRLEKLQAALAECEAKKTCELDSFVAAIKIAIRDAWKCIDKVIPGSSHYGG